MRVFKKLAASVVAVGSIMVTMPAFAAGTLDATVQLVFDAVTIDPFKAAIGGVMVTVVGIAVLFAAVRVSKRGIHMV